MKGRYISSNPKETREIGEKFGKEILEKGKKEGAVIVSLKGDLGAGKTTFIQGMAKGLGIEEKILSPTFVIQKKFALKNKKFKHFYHFDCYRLSGGEELTMLGFLEIINNSNNVVAIEWPENIKGVLPKNASVVKFSLSHSNCKERIIDFKDGQ